MAERQDQRLPEPKMDPASLFREEVITDRKVGTIRVLTPIRSDGSAGRGPARPCTWAKRRSTPPWGRCPSASNSTPTPCRTP